MLRVGHLRPRFLDAHPLPPEDPLDVDLHDPDDSGLHRPIPRSPTTPEVSVSTD